MLNAEEIINSLKAQVEILNDTLLEIETALGVALFCLLMIFAVIVIFSFQIVAEFKKVYQEKKPSDIRKSSKTKPFDEQNSNKNNDSYN